MLGMCCRQPVSLPYAAQPLRGVTVIRAGAFSLLESKQCFITFIWWHLEITLEIELISMFVHKTFPSVFVVCLVGDVISYKIYTCSTCVEHNLVVMDTSKMVRIARTLLARGATKRLLLKSGWEKFKNPQQEQQWKWAVHPIRERPLICCKKKRPLCNQWNSNKFQRMLHNIYSVERIQTIELCVHASKSIFHRQIKREKWRGGREGDRIFKWNLVFFNFIVYSA